MNYLFLSEKNRWYHDHHYVEVSTRDIFDVSIISNFIQVNKRSNKICNATPIVADLEGFGRLDFLFRQYNLF